MRFRRFRKRFKSFRKKRTRAFGWYRKIGYRM